MSSPETKPSTEENPPLAVSPVETSVKLSTASDPTEEQKTIALQLDDVIKITDPENEELNDNEFIIDYIDKTKIKLINTETLNLVLLRISPDGVLGDGTITNISIISRNENKGYARQNGLLPGTWINVYFGDDPPLVITGEITNIEEDMIEIRCYPDNEIIYLNFDYKGLPEDVPIETIEIRDRPRDTEREKAALEDNEEEVLEDLQTEGTREATSAEELEILQNVPPENVKDQLRQFILKADQIQFGAEELGPITQYVDIDSSQQRFSIEMQANDLLDEMLSTIPNVQRTTSVLNNIHIMIERFKQLRQQFSTFDVNGNVTGASVKESTYKPLVDELIHFRTLLYWILPVVKNIKKVYNIPADTDEGDFTDIIPLNTIHTMDEVKHFVEKYQSNEFPDEQNKYVTLIKEINPFFTPFDSLNPESLHDILYEKDVEANINAIVDTLDDFYSSVVAKDVIRSRRFVIQKYNLGLNRLNAIQMSGSKMITEKLPLTQADQLSLKSIITLPEPAIRFSRINLPGTNILDRSNLNTIFINYWELLRKKTDVTTIDVDNLDEEIEFDANTFISEIKNYNLLLSSQAQQTESASEPSLSKFDIYKKFLETIIPKIRVLFTLVKKYVTGKLSIVDIVGYLEPFLIYNDDLTYQQYNTIKSFLDEKISLFNKTFVDRSRNFSFIKNIRKMKVLNPAANAIYNIFAGKDNELSARVFDSYDYHGNTETYYLTNSELLEKITLKDSGRLYNSAVSLMSIPLMFPDNLSSIFESEKTNIQTEKDALDKEKDKCTTYIIAKQYRSMEEILLDNGKEIYFDKKYDKTNYSLLEQYEGDMIKMQPEDFVAFLVKKLEASQKISPMAAEYLADTLISGVKLVREGDYALFYDLDKDAMQYYVRKNNTWVLDEKVAKESFANDDSLLCNIQSECIDVQKNLSSQCESTAINEKSLLESSLTQIMNSFDKKYYLSKVELENRIKENFDYYLNTFDKINEIEFRRKFQYNNKQFLLGTTQSSEEDKAVIISPFQKLLDTILSQNDLVKLQNDIVRFGNMFTREAIDDFTGGIDENPHWRYCVKTGVELLPTFRFTLANAFQIGYDSYKNTLEELKQTNGKLSDDADAWIDKYTGREMCKIDFDVEEGYEEGYKISSRAIMEQDIGDSIVSASKKLVKNDSPEVKLINNILSHMASSMSITIEDQREFIIQSVTTALLSILPTQEQHKIEMQKMVKQQKTPITYESVYNSSILYTTLGMLLIAIQTSIPSIKTKKTFPGCVRSFTGFPIEGAGDDSSVTYLACIAYKIRNNTAPWSVLMKKKEEFIATKIKDVISKVLLNIPGITRKFDEKMQYLLEAPELENIPKEHDISNWYQFLPPLFPFKIPGLKNITQEFKSKLFGDLKTGASTQRENIMIVESKIILFSLAIQEKIQNVITHKKLLLTNAASEPFVENSCCNENSSVSTIDYFIRESGDILSYNTIVGELANILEDITFITKAPLFFSTTNTKNVYPVLPNQEFNEDTIYRAFIVFCKFTSLIPITEDLIALCTNKPEFISPNDSFSEIITKLKRDGRMYTNDSLLRLLQIVNRKNIIHVDIEPRTATAAQKITNLLESYAEQNEELVCPALRKLIDSTLDTYDLAVTKDTEEMRDLKNYLERTNQSMRGEITDFIKKNNSLTGKRQKYVDTLLQELFTWNDSSIAENTRTISDSKTYNSIEFIKSYMHDFFKTFPNIILNKVDYEKVQIQAYWGISQNHVKDIKKIMKEYYQRLRPFYSDNVLSSILSTIQENARNLMLLVDETPYYTLIKYKDRERHSIFDKDTSDLIFEQYFLLLLLEYKNLSDNESMLFYERGEGVTSVEDIFNVEDLEEQELKLDITRVAFVEEVTLKGNKKELKTSVANLLLTYLNIMRDHKDIIDRSYADIMDKVFKISEREKDTFTDRLKAMTDEERSADTILKMNKLGVWSKGLQKGLTTYTKETYDDERDVMDKITEIERQVRKNRNVTDENIDQYLEDRLEEMDADAATEAEAYDMSRMTEDYDDGNFESDEIDDYEEHY